MSEKERQNAKLPSSQGTWNQAGFGNHEPDKKICYGRVRANADARDVPSLLTGWAGEANMADSTVKVRTKSAKVYGGLGRQWVMILIVFVQLLLLGPVDGAEVR